MGRRNLTPLSSELKFNELQPAPPGRVERLRRRFRRERTAPATRAGAIARGLLRLVVWTAAASGIAVVVDLFTNRSNAFGFYIVGGGLLAIAILTSTGGTRRGGYISQYERAGRVNRSFVWILVGVLVLGIGVLLEALGS